MFNFIHSLFHDPVKGWDPISAEYASSYRQIASVDREIVDLFERVLGGLQGKAIADIGSGPGHYAVEFARRGASVLCADVSANYLRIAEQRMADSGLEAEYALGYIDHVNRITRGGFDAVFSNVAWCYCMNDYSFARELLLAVRPGGVVFTRQTTEAWETSPTFKRRLAYFLNRRFALKLGHPHPPPGRIEASFRRIPGCSVYTESVVGTAEIVVAHRAA